MIVAVIVIQNSVAGVLRRAGWPEGGIRIFPLILLGMAILLKPQLTQVFERLRKEKLAARTEIEALLGVLGTMSRRESPSAKPACRPRK